MTSTRDFSSKCFKICVANKREIRSKKSKRRQTFGAKTFFFAEQNRKCSISSGRIFRNKVLFINVNSLAKFSGEKRRRSKFILKKKSFRRAFSLFMKKRNFNRRCFRAQVNSYGPYQSSAGRRKSSPVLPYPGTFTYFPFRVPRRSGPYTTPFFDRMSRGSFSGS